MKSCDYLTMIHTALHLVNKEGFKHKTLLEVNLSYLKDCQNSSFVESVVHIFYKWLFGGFRERRARLLKLDCRR